MQTSPEAQAQPPPHPLPQLQPVLVAAPASPPKATKVLPKQGVVLVDTLAGGTELCERWRQEAFWAFALDYTAADTRASKQLEMPRVGMAGASGEGLRPETRNKGQEFRKLRKNECLTLHCLLTMQ